MFTETEMEILRNSDNWQDYHIAMGKYYGFKSCCISYFVKLDNKVAHVSKMLYGKPLNNSPYVLYPQCRRKLELEKIKYRYQPRNIYPFTEFKDFKERLYTRLNK